MSTYRLDKLFAPASVAVVGASRRGGTPGRIVFTSLAAAGFKGTLYPVNPKYDEIDGVACAPDLAALAEVPDLIVVVVPPRAVVRVVEEAGQLGVSGALLMTPGLGHGEGSIAEAARVAARKHGLRLVGPDSLGIMAPPVRLNASYAAHVPERGDLALISQSGAVTAGLVEWAMRRQVGFSGVITLGDQVDVDFADCLDHFAGDMGTRAILLYVEKVADARKFMSAARAAARAKPVVVIKSGRHRRTAQLAATHTGALAVSDAVYDAAFRRAGLLRVLDLDELFAAAETLGRQRPFHGRRLAIVTNDHGIGLLAVDRLADLGGSLADLSGQTAEALADQVPPGTPLVNPINIGGEAGPERLAAVMKSVLADRSNDAVLVLTIPTALSDSSALANATVEAIRADRSRRALPKPVFSVWLGQDEETAHTFEKAGIPHFQTEAEAIQGFMHLVRYREAQDLLMETPDSLPHDFTPDVEAARRIVAGVIADGRSWLDPREVAGLLAAYDIPVVPLTLVPDPQAAAVAARPILAAGGTVAVKIVSPDIIHKSDVGGVRLDLTNEEAVRRAATDILERTRRGGENIRISGLAVQPMVRRRKARELIVGLADDPTFGPVVVFGRGGTAVEVINDRSLALPPLDMKLAEVLIGRTRVSRILKAYRDVPAADARAIQLALVKLSQLAGDVPEVREVDINPLLADETGVLAIDARVRVVPTPPPARRSRTYGRFAIRPYPREWERTITCRGGQKLFVRPARPEDESLFVRFLARVSEEDLRLRFFAPVREFNHAFLARLVQIDYARAIAFIALDPDTGEMMGVVRLHADANHHTGEYAVLVRSDLKGIGLGWALMQMMIEWAKADGLRVVAGQVLRDNLGMLAMCRKLGFNVATDPTDPSIMLVRLPLASPGATAAVP